MSGAFVCSFAYSTAAVLMIALFLYKACSLIMPCQSLHGNLCNSLFYLFCYIIVFVGLIFICDSSIPKEQLCSLLLFAIICPFFVVILKIIPNHYLLVDYWLAVDMWCLLNCVMIIDIKLCLFLFFFVRYLSFINYSGEIWLS